MSLVKITEKIIVFASTNPDKILDFSNSDVGENVFRTRIDSQDYMIKPCRKILKDCSSEYKTLYDKIKQGLGGICPDYIISFNLFSNFLIKF